jgi:uncharacterized membrane protein
VINTGIPVVVVGLTSTGCLMIVVGIVLLFVGVGNAGLTARSLHQLRRDFE